MNNAAIENPFRPKAFQLKFSASASFRRYMVLMNRAHCTTRGEARTDEFLDQLGRECEEAAFAIAVTKGQCIDRVLEKLYIWRTERFGSTPSTELSYDDLFPLSAYFDLKTLLAAERLAQEGDARLISNIKTWQG